MMRLTILETLQICERHAERLNWAMTQLQGLFPLSAVNLGALSDIEIAILDQITTRFAKLQDLMGAQLFPAVLELTKEQGELRAFIDKLNRLEQIGALESAAEWLLLRAARNSLAHDYPESLELQASSLNQLYLMARRILMILTRIKQFIAIYL